MTHEGRDHSAVAEGERQFFRPNVIIMDEHTPGNILSDRRRGLDLRAQARQSYLNPEGFAQSEKRQAKLADLYIGMFGFARLEPFLDVGYGRNIFVANRIAQKGIPAYALDVASYEPGQPTKVAWQAPQQDQTNAAGANILIGDIAKAEDADSFIRDKKFGTILFSGSWQATEQHLTVCGRKAVSDQSILRTSRHLLKDNGMLGVVSSRYAYFGSEYAFDHYVDEKLSFIDVYADMVQLGAKSIYVFGMSHNGLDFMIERELVLSELFPDRTEERLDSYHLSEMTIRKIQNQLLTPDSINLQERLDLLPPESDRRTEQVRFENAIAIASQSRELHKIARIDAIFAEFRGRK
jgi:hypothetical protein